MSNKFTAARESGFTLVELLIVVIILAILAAIVVPQFSATTEDAKQSAYVSNLSSLRAVTELYRQQHGVYPGNAAAVAATCTNGTNQVAAAGTAAFPVQLNNYTNIANSACTGFDADEFRYGPYLKDGIPVNPLGTNNNVTVVATGVLGGLTSGGTGGWRFDSITGELIGDH